MGVILDSKEDYNKMFKSLLSVFFVFFFYVLSAQEADKLVVKNGKKYFSHSVVKGETIFRICKNYSVTSEQLIDYLSEKDPLFILTHPMNAISLGKKKWPCDDVFRKVSEITKKNYNFDIKW